MTVTPADPPSAAPADCGDVVCTRVAGRSVLTRVWSTDPLKLLTPRHSGDASHVVLSSYGGGLVGGDHVGLRLDVRPAARLVVTTQSAGKVYRTDGPASTQTLRAAVADDALLAILPDALCAFAGSKFSQAQHYTLTASANLVWLDWMSSGRHGRGERWAMDGLVSRTTVDVAGRTRLRETLSLDGDAGSPMRAGRFDCYAVLAVFGPLLGGLIEAGRAVVRGLDVSTGTLLASDSAVAGGAVFRVLGSDVQTVGPLLARLLAPLAASTGGNPWGRQW